MAVMTKNKKNEDLWDLRKGVDKMFRDFLEPISKKELIYLPSLDIYEKDNALIIEVELPGISKDDIKINVTDGILSISAEKNKKEYIKNEKIVIEEISYGTCRREIELPQFVNTEKIDAVYKDGVLRIVLPKREKPKSKEIKVR